MVVTEMLVARWHGLHPVELVMSHASNAIQIDNKKRCRCALPLTYSPSSFSLPRVLRSRGKSI
jgi:hypothetical protein